MRSQARRALLLALAMVHAAAGNATNFGFLKNAPVGQFKEEDVKMMRAAADELLREDAKGASREWHNEKTGNSGRFEILDIFTSQDGRHCKKLLVVTRAKSQEQQSVYPLCAAPDGRWLIDTEAAP
jgi:surface antigen